MAADIKPVAWRFRIDGGRWIVVTDYAAIGFSTAESGAAPEIEELYPQSAIDTLRAEVERLRKEVQRLTAFLRRYRDEVPLGHQPHMIAHEVDAALAAQAKDPS